MSKIYTFGNRPVTTHNVLIKTPTTKACTAIKIIHITPRIGRAVDGVDMSKTQDAATVHQLREAWLERGVLLFPKQNINEKQLDTFTANFLETIIEPTGPIANDKKVHDGDKSGIRNDFPPEN